ncbi:tetratricopeptide repeat protein 23-like [Lingula anatina]|uniref:Tetratricopeptide repeat protein 23-like n=1 Tax=Lingula anatina TaxID=7574 RepID=A0A1S3J765_LINAN|nr:tetratricopeptide repeat protein 23-like [Lingula anatina]|eukprot:XP_013406257.1 tetratricopeptide repeat protein 23-like [Lingula anatina]
MDADNVLMPIVEVPSESSFGRPDSANTQNDELSSYRSDEEYNTEEEYDDDNAGTPTPRSSSGKKTKRRRTRSKKNGIDMTPPEKLLRRSEKKAKKYKEEKKADKAIKELIKCTALARIVHGDSHWKYAEAYTNLAEGYFELKGYTAQAHYHSENAKNIMLSGVQMPSSQRDKAKIMEVLVKTYYTMGRALTKLKKYTEADQALQRAEKIAQERSRLPNVNSDDCDEMDIKISIALGRLNGAQEKAASATSYFDKAIELIEKQHGNDSIRLIPVYQDIGRVEQNKGKHANHDRAIEMYLQAHSIAGANYSEGTPELAETAKALAMAYSNTGDPDAETSAESYLNESLAAYQSMYGPEHVQTLAVQDDLARLMIRTEREDEALSVLRSTLSSKTEVYGEFSDEVADTYKLIGSVHLSRGDMEKALKSLSKCHTIETAAHGSNHKRPKETQKTIDVLMSNPSLASKMPKSKREELQQRPRFNSIVNRSSAAKNPLANTF